jgi:uncharacterized phage protein gp47/JayE
MMDDKMLDEVMPIPDKEELLDEKIEELKAEGFKITNMTKGGIFYTLLMICLTVYIDIVKLLRVVISGLFIFSADGSWLKFKATDYSKRIKEALQTQGDITLSRPAAGSAITIPLGHIFKTKMDADGNEFRFIVQKTTILTESMTAIKVPVMAEKSGAAYNLPEDSITKSLTHLEGGLTITNTADWITREGSDEEEQESFRSRVQNSWAEVGALPIRDKYKNVAEGVQGVLMATVDDMHPRGQGTVNIIITSTQGTATQSLIDTVLVAVEAIKAPYDNLLVKSATVQTQNIACTITVPKTFAIEGGDLALETKAEKVIRDSMLLTQTRKLNELILFDLGYNLKRKIPNIKKAEFTTPTADVILPIDQVVVIGTVDVTIVKVD